MRNTLAFLAIAAGLVAWTQDASACGAIGTVWGQGAPPGGALIGAPSAGEPDDATAHRRYSARCGMRTTGPGQAVQDGTPNEQRYLVRFYAYTGATGGGSAKIFSGRFGGSPGSEAIGVTYNNGTGTFDVNTSGASGTANGILPNRWYRVEMDFNRTANTLSFTVQGAGSNTNATTTPANGQIAGIGGSDVVDYVQMGWLSTTGTMTGELNFDAFESRRATAIGRLCRGDANNSNSISAADRTTITAELGGTGALAAGQPDCDESGAVSAADRTCVTGRLGQGAVCP